MAIVHKLLTVGADRFLSQLSRSLDERINHRPRISDLKSQDMVNCFDNIAFLYRDEYYNKDSFVKGVTEIITVRNKFGNIGTVNLVWLPEFQKFANILVNSPWMDEHYEEYCEDMFEEE